MSGISASDRLIGDIRNCNYCSQIIRAKDYATVYCTKYRGPYDPIPFDPAICSLCGDYKKMTR